MRTESVKLFYVGLAWAGITLGDFANSVKVSRNFLHEVLTGKKTSARITKAINMFTAEQATNLMQYLND